MKKQTLPVSILKQPESILLLALGITLAAMFSPHAAISAENVINIPVTVTGISPGRPFHIPRGIFCDQLNNETYVADSGSGQILIFDDHGWPLYQFTHWVDGPKGRRHGEPHCVVATASGNIFVVDGLSPVIDILDYRGRLLFGFDPRAYLPAHDKDARLTSVLALGPLGNVYCICQSQDGHYLLGFDPEGAFLKRTLLARGNQLKRVTGLHVGADRIFVTDMAAEFAVQIFDLRGKCINAFGKHDAGWGNFSFPSSVTVTADNHIWIPDMIRQIVNRFDENGDFVDFLGGQGEGPGSMAYPCAVTHNAAGMIVVLEKVGARYQVFEVKEEVAAIPK